MGSLGLPCAVLHCSIANFNIWKVNQIVKTNSTPTKDFVNDLIPRLTMKPYDEVSKQSNIILLYANTSYDQVFNLLSRQCDNREDIVYSAGQVGVDTLAFIVKKTQRLHPSYKMDNITPQFFVFKKGGQTCRELGITLNIMAATMTTTMSIFTLTDLVKEGELFDLVFDKFRDMNDEERVTMKGKIKSITAKDHTDEQKVFLKCYDDFIAKLKVMKNTHGTGVAWNAKSPPPTTIVAPLSELVNLEQETNNITTTTTTTTNIIIIIIY